MEEQREVRQFDLEAQRRQKRLFVTLMIGVAILAALAGIVIAFLVIDPLGPPKIKPLEPPPPVAEPPPEHVEIDDWDDDSEPPPTKAAPTLKARPSGDDINRGLAKLRSALDACARTHGAIDGARVKLDFTVGGDGRVEQCFAQPPYAKTPLGTCVVRVVKNKGRFRRSRQGLADVHRTVTLRRNDL